MTGPEHYRAAEEYLEKARGSMLPQYDGYVTRAQAHATLALAAATALTGPVAAEHFDDPEYGAWQAAAGTVPS
ncbi:hypothetical protein [Planomonospora venezuelensis]|uniref:Uncharacterized protein n=1 Tax=Planomonospora venezuelensis TaxID=1999 RepID=A0A841DAD0_PLAVE|nr:hypothetical protein [Planomonospora venezuelensis]MBB5965085.1 hypothetical protein [Planomonospora venezuelensis]GIN04997.1 hypothetical protein Pve01_66550 [Planomonospora venezuelensis]